MKEGEKMISLRLEFVQLELLFIAIDFIGWGLFLRCWKN